MMISIDERRDIVVPGDKSSTIGFCAEQFITLAQSAIQKNQGFYVALSGGSTPKSIFELISSEDNKQRIDWSKIFLFWGDERAVPPDDPESNFAMAMSYLQDLPINPTHIFRMRAEEKDLKSAAKNYERTIQNVVPNASFDLVMLGMGDDGHTASLFPFTEALHVEDHLVVANYIPQKETWRMTFTYSCIHKAKAISIYVLGKSKAEMLKTVLKGSYDPDRYPIQRIGLPSNKALFIADDEAASLLIHP